MEQTETDFGTFARFYTIEEAKALQLLLESNSIPYVIRHDVNQLDAVILGDSMEPMFIVSVPSERFDEVNQLIDHSVEGITEPDLNGDGDLTLIASENQEQLDPVWMVLSYLLSLIPVVGIFIGLTLITATRRLRNGARVSMYDEYTKKHGRLMFLIALLITFWFAWWKILALII